MPRRTPNAAARLPFEDQPRAYRRLHLRIASSSGPVSGVAHVAVCRAFGGPRRIPVIPCGMAARTSRRLRLFVRVVETGSFSKASARVGITQPTATKHIAALEARLSARLFHRSTRGVTPTEVGTLYYERCKRIVEALDEADDVAALMQSRLQGTLRISTRWIRPPRADAARAALQREHPGIQVDSASRPYVNIVEHGVDLAIRMGRMAVRRSARAGSGRTRGFWSARGRTLARTARRASLKTSRRTRR